ncbi:sugar ABC transporter ATP-binding protein [Acrocarpospora catenulata]|uniref:sugar ABC transporter ATP-binding protein n=1 Tax=Acrocarpospora catenulata TaxID=2836182 RepID=UPI001BD9FAD6|nr:sugar ABC transporter ATP-binding protein [Acrocarpospora catenulata]
MPEAIVVDQVSKAFGPTLALSAVSLTVNRGESRALIGKNGAGKSTLMSILTGLSQPDSGSVQVLAEGDAGGASAVGCVYQRSTLIPAATAAENIALARFPRSRAGLIRWPEVRRQATELLAEWEYADLAGTPVEQLEPLERKVVEICRVLSQGPRVLLLDEPTAGLDRGASQRLFGHIERARARGVTIIYVSHHLHEVFEVCDSVTVLRDGRAVLTEQLTRMTVPDLVDAMVGEAAATAGGGLRAARPESARPPVLVASGVTAPKVNGVDLALRPGECVGLTGLDGAGHMQLAEVLTGQRPAEAGTVTLDGRPLPLGDIRGCIEAGIGFTPEDRHTSGYVPALSVAENATLNIMPRFANGFRLISGKKRDAFYSRLAGEWNIKAYGAAQPTEELSGGNQQKVVLARSVAADPKVLVLVNPTAGVDVSAKNSIYTTIEALRADGQAVLIVTTDDADLEVCDRVVVMVHGEVSAELRHPFTEGMIAAAVQGGGTTEPDLLPSGEEDSQ